MNNGNRDKVIVRTSIIGICANVVLALFKALAGAAVHSIAMVLDAVNNLSDALSSVITIIGTKLAGRLPDKKHPLGYGRVEYLSGMIVAAIVLYAGITSAVESVKKIIHPEKADYTVVSLVIIAVAVVVKLVLGRYVKKKGEEVNSSALEASGADAAFDAILSASVLASAVIYLITGLSLEAFVGLIISFFIIKAGLEMIRETYDAILGERADAEVTQKIRRLIIEEPDVRGAYDLILYNYGPDRNYGTVHVELPDTMTVDKVDKLTRKIQSRVFTETGVIMTGVGLYSYNTGNDEAAKIRNRLQKIVLSNEHALQMHGFYLDEETKTIRFDVVLSFDTDPNEGLKTVYEQVCSAFPDYNIVIAPDVDVSD
ncbi:MAG: cation transporter [Lachnospiraceae bacterium]|nr:cation transporter [Lachnospiraceae bacterium]